MAVYIIDIILQLSLVRSCSWVITINLFVDSTDQLLFIRLFDFIHSLFINIRQKQWIWPIDLTFRKRCWIGGHASHSRYIYGDFASSWQVFVPHALRFGYYFVSVYHHLKEHYVNFFRFFQDFLNYFIHTSNYWIFKNSYYQSFFLEI